MANGTHEDEYISAAAAGEILGVSPRQAMRYGASEKVRTILDGRRILYHAGDVRALAHEHQQRRQRVNDTTTRGMSRPNEWRTKYEEANEALLAAAHKIGALEQQIKQLQDEVARRPTTEAYAALEARYNELRQLQAPAEPEAPAASSRPWWKFWGD
jgi:hypothetical protein